MLLAELEVHHSRPIAPTRRVALGRTTLPCDPAPGFGGLLLGAVVARFGQDVDPDDIPELVALTHELEAGRRIPQPRLRHRFQDDRIGLTRSTHRLHRDLETDELRLDFTTDKGAPAQQVLGAVYAAGGLPRPARATVLVAVRRGLAWTGGVGPALIAHLAGRSAASLSVAALADPVGWAMQVLGFSVLDERPDRVRIQRSYRHALLTAHPDHGGDSDDAARRIADIAEARRILLAR
ncbi:MAG: hypothetical protein GWN79_07445 [Actinobacteria bacterium]|nr:hypothetical protein [Actinomycetota bacterium]NIS30740.1 hypothetical protein [Actinomycetota bacterium]NIT95261.1 hypothetical protein [Actinomycetota bacterium]NIU18933.1 hypothetical protein [Actinomycetota bacterium]NIU65952.1 hypothetical protein [Actinomycetota bacterium]